MSELFIYQADTYCDSCGADIRARLEREGITDEGESDGFPQYALEGETDGPDHCASQEDCLEGVNLSAYGLSDTDELVGAESLTIGALLTDALTDEGVDYLREMIAAEPRTAYQRALHAYWSETFTDSL